MLQHLNEEVKKHRISQRKLAKLLNLSTKTVNQKMQGKIEFKRTEMLEISKILGKSMDFLFGEWDR